MVKRPKNYQMPMLPVVTWNNEGYCDICEVHAKCRVVELTACTISLCVLCLATLLEQLTGIRHRNIMLSNLISRETGLMTQASKDKKAWEEANAAGTD